MVLRLHPAATAEPCIQLRRFFQLMSGRVLALFQQRELAIGCSIEDRFQIQNELAFKDLRRPC